MDARHWLDTVQAEFARQKLPPWYVDRLITELSDHLTDLVEETMSKDANDLQNTDFEHVAARLGNPSEIATAAATEFRRQRFSRRHPILMFGVLPIITLPLVWIGVPTALMLWSYFSGTFEDGGTLDLRDPKYSEAVGITWAYRGVVFVSIVLSAAFYCRLARKAALGWKWTLLACGLLAIIAGMAVFKAYEWDGGEHGAFVMGLNYWVLPTLPQVIQFTAPLAIGGWAIWRQRRQQFGTLAT